MKSFRDFVAEDHRAEVMKHIEAVRKHVAQGTVYTDHAAEKAGVPEKYRDVVIHGVAHGTNTLGFRDKMKALKEFAPVPGSGVVQAPLTPHVKISHSLLIRMFEFFLENEEDLEDSELHEIAETIFEIGSTGTIVDTSDYDYIVGDEAIDGTDDTDYSDNGWYDESVNEDEKVRTADEIKREIVSKHAGHFPQAVQDYLHKAKTYGNRAINHLYDEHGIKPGHAKAAIDKIKDETQQRLGGSGPKQTNAQRIDRYLSQKWIGPRGK